MVDKKTIKKLISIFPSKNLKKVYEEDFNNDIYPSWDEDDIMSLIHGIYFYVKSDVIFNFLNSFIKKVKSTDKKYKIKRILMNIGKGNKSRDIMDDYDEFSKYVIIKNIFKPGDLIKFNKCNELMFGIVGNFDYDKLDKLYLEGKRYYDYTDLVYYSYTLYNFEIINSYDVFFCHDHPSKLIIEKASENELCIKQKELAHFIIEKILYVKSNNNIG